MGGFKKKVILAKQASGFVAAGREASRDAKRLRASDPGLHNLSAPSTPASLAKLPSSSTLASQEESVSRSPRCRIKREGGRDQYDHPSTWSDVTSDFSDRHSEANISTTSSSQSQWLASQDVQPMLLAQQNRSLKLQVKLLQKMVQEKDCQIRAQKNTIKTLKVKETKTGDTLAKFARLTKKRIENNEQFEPNRVRGETFKHQQVRRLEGGRLSEFVTREEGQEAESNEANGWLTPQGCISLAIRRNLGNASAESTGLMLLRDVSKQSILRSECRTGAALLASTRSFFYEWRYRDENMSKNDTSILFLQYREDGTNSAKHRQKMTAMEVQAAYVIAKQSDLEDLTPANFCSIRRLADVVPVHDGYGTGVGTMALAKKMLESLAAPTWDSFLSRAAWYSESKSLWIL